MPFTDEQKNIIIGFNEKAVEELQRKIDSITERNNQFISTYGDKTGPMNNDLTQITDSELSTRNVVLTKLRSEILNMQSPFIFELENTEKEKNRR